MEIYDYGQTTRLGNDGEADGKAGTSPYMAMEYVAGGTLKDEISRRGTLGPQVAAGVALQISEALARARDSAP